MSGSTPRRGRSLAVLSGALALDLSGLGALNAAIPGIGTSLGMGEAALQGTVTAYAAGFACVLLVAGRLADRFGRRRLFGLGLATITAFSLLAALATGPEMLLAGRAGQGVGAGLGSPAALALLAQLYPEPFERTRALAVYASVGAASFSTGVVLGGALTQSLGWRSVLALSVVVGLVLLPGLRILPAPQPRPGDRLDYAGAVLGAAAVLLLLLASGRASTSGGDATSVVLVVGGLAVTALFVAHERRHPAPLVPRSVVRLPSVRQAAITAFLNYTIGVGMLFFAPLYLQGVLGFSPLLSAIAVLPASVVLVLVSTFLTGRLIQKLGTTAVMLLGVAFLGAAVLTWIPTSVRVSDYAAWLVPGLVLTGVGQGLAYPAMTAAALAGSDERTQGSSAAINVTVQQLGASVGVGVLVLVATTWSSWTTSRLAGYHVAYVAGALMCLVGALAIAALAWGRAPRGATPEAARAGAEDQ